MQRVLLSTGLALVTLIPALSASATTRVRIGGTVYTCPNSCVITQYPNGGLTVRDSRNEPVVIQPSNETR